MRKILKGFALTLAATVAVGIAGVTPAAAENEGCIGLPDYPAVFLCVNETHPENAAPVPGPTEQVVVPEFCYLLGCLPTQTVNVNTVQPSGQPVLVFTYQGQTHSVPDGSDPVDQGQVVDALNGALGLAGQTVFGLCGQVARLIRELELGYMTCAS